MSGSARSLPDAAPGAGPGSVLNPRSIAIIGASPDPTKRGHQAVRSLLESGYSGRIIPVHPAGGELLGLPVARSPSDLDAPPDLVLVCTPAPTVPAILREWGQSGARGAVVLASGFRETGQAGQSLEDEIRDVIADTGIRVIGPNTSGILNVPLGLNLIGIRGVRAGPLALLVQSGNITLQLVTEAMSRTGQGFTYCIGVGNKLDIGFAEYIAFLGAHDDTRAIMMHVEGFRNGRTFLEMARTITPRKPVVLLKAARTAAGGEVARSHTGAIAGSYDVLRAGLRQAGVVEVHRTDELLHVAETLATQPAAPPGRGIALLSDGGGHATLAVDTLHDRNAPLATLSAATRDALRQRLGPAAAVANPIDLAGAADRSPDVFADALRIIAGDDAVGAVLVVGLFGGYAIRFAESLLDAEIHAATAMASIAREMGTALVVHSLYAARRTEPLRALTDAGVPVIESLDVACTCIAALTERGATLRRMADTPNAWVVGARRLEEKIRLGGSSLPIPGLRPDATAGAEVTRAISAARAERRTTLLETESRAMLAAFGAPLVPATFCPNAGAAAHAADVADRPVAIRVISPSAPHKTEAGGVRLNVEGGDAAATAFVETTESVRRFVLQNNMPDDVRGVLVSPMQDRPVAELIVGVIRDPLFGPVLTVGAGGTAVEFLRDIAIRVLPVTADEVREMLSELRIGPVLHGIRGKEGADIPAIVDATLAVAAAAIENDSIAEIEVNPLFAYPDRCVALDTRAFLTD
jgi:acetyltransferase